MRGAPFPEVWIDYTNWRGVRDWRRVVPIHGTLRFDKNEWHPEWQWMFDAWDVEKDARRTFALAGIHAWAKEKPE